MATADSEKLCFELAAESLGWNTPPLGAKTNQMPRCVRRGISLPVHPSLSIDQIAQVKKMLGAGLRLLAFEHAAINKGQNIFCPNIIMMTGLWECEARNNPWHHFCPSHYYHLGE